MSARFRTEDRAEAARDAAEARGQHALVFELASVGHLVLPFALVTVDRERVST